ncbi:MAG TPA: hypothetical protein VGX23_02265 [Actinocrinis sp.]|nr:hypothetical protein [Actinocrinis sp.]
MHSPRSILEDTDWARPGHAYGVATDTPDRLMELLDPRPHVQAHALAQLDMSVLHQDSLYSATAPAALFIAGVLTGPRTDAPHESAFPWDERTRPLRASLIAWLGRVGDAATYGEGDDTEPFEDEDERNAVLACREIRADLAVAITPFLDARERPVRDAAHIAHTRLAAPTKQHPTPDDPH